MNLYKGTVEIDDDTRVRFPVTVKASSWQVAANRATSLGLRLYRQNRKGRRVTIKGVEVYLMFLRKEVGVVQK